LKDQLHFFMGKIWDKWEGKIQKHSKAMMQDIYEYKANFYVIM